MAELNSHVSAMFYIFPFPSSEGIQWLKPIWKQIPYIKVNQNVELKYIRYCG